MPTEYVIRDELMDGSFTTLEEATTASAVDMLYQARQEAVARAAQYLDQQMMEPICREAPVPPDVACEAPRGVTINPYMRYYTEPIRAYGNSMWGMGGVVSEKSSHSKNDKYLHRFAESIFKSNLHPSDKSGLAKDFLDRCSDLFKEDGVSKNKFYSWCIDGV